MKIKESRVMSMTEARNLAINENWFTRADNEEYGEWLRYLSQQSNLTPRKLYEAAEMVLEYSDISAEEEFTRTVIIEDIMYLIAKHSRVYFDIYED